VYRRSAEITAAPPRCFISAKSVAKHNAVIKTSNGRASVGYRQGNYLNKRKNNEKATLAAGRRAAAGATGSG
ncbi:hypothetical protein M8369_28375, partial [Klebsiella pneumoniae]|nr:hypothetical protein [Klebsiella pneumoniae]